MDFSFLNNVSALEIVKEQKERISRAIPKNPEGMRLRIFKDGSIFPSKELAEKFNLEYSNKNDKDLTACGFDIWSSKDWGQYPKDVQQAVFISPINKDEAKVTVFSSVDYNTDGTPINSVMTQGAKRPQIIEWLRDVYGKQIINREIVGEEIGQPSSFFNDDTLFGTKNYVDLEVNTEVVVFEGLANYFIPKEVKKGKKAGSMSYETRKNLLVYPLTIVENTVVGEDELGKLEEEVLEEVE